MKTILVTGGAGFIGSNFIKHTLANQPTYQIINLDALTYAGNLENLDDIHNPNHLFIHGDIADRGLVHKIFETYPIDSVINFAAESHVDRSILSPDVFIQTNIVGMQILLDVAKSFWKTNPKDIHCELYKPGVKFIQISTDEVYGSHNTEEPFHEASPLLPSNPYAASKAAADLLALSYYKTYKFPVSITRCSNNYGPYQFPEKLIPLTVTKALKNSKIPVYGSGLQSRDWLHVIDHCKGILQVLKGGGSGEIYNISANCDKQNIQVIELILKKMNKPWSLIEYVKDRPGHDFRYALDSHKVRTQLNWKPGYAFEDGLENTIEWYLNNQIWLNNIASRRDRQCN